MAKPIGTLGNIDTLIVAGRTFTDLDNLKTLIGQLGGSATSQNCTFREVGTAVGYQVPVSKSFKICALRIISIVDTGAVAACTNIDLNYSDNDVGYGTNTALTNGVGIAGSGQTSRFVSAIDAGQSVEYALNWLIPTGKYFTMVGQYLVSSQIHMVIAYGYEV